MNKKICPECGYEDSTDAYSICPECGCPLSNNHTANGASEPKQKEIQSVDNDLVDSIERNGCIATWRNRRAFEASTAKTMDIISTVFEACGVILLIAFILYLIISGIKSGSVLEKFYQSSRPFITTIAGAFAIGKIAETISYNNELRNCTSWLRGNHLDTRYCLELKDYGKTKKSSVFFDDHRIEIAYCGVHPEYVKKCSKTRIIKCVVYVISAIITAVFSFPVIEQMLIQIERESANWYIMIGFGAAIFVLEFINWIIKRFLEKDFYNKHDTWFYENKT